MERILEGAENIELSGDDIHSITDGQAAIWSYPELIHVSVLDELFSDAGVAVILYDTIQPNVGHWVALFKREGDLIEFFDPYGLAPDTELDITNPMHLRAGRGAEEPHLTQLIRESGLKLVYNKTQLQRFKEDINTCGRHVGVRIRFKELPIKKYIKLITSSKYTADELVTLLTLLV